MKFLWFALACVAAVVPALVVHVIATNIGPVSLPPAFDPKAAHYPDAIERLESTSEALITVALATIGGAGFLLLRRSSVALLAGAAAVFMCSVQSLYYATMLGHFSALTLAADQGDIKNLVPLLDNQALALLAAGISLALTAGIAAFTGESR
jgi:hypothetical protein